MLTKGDVITHYNILDVPGKSSYQLTKGGKMQDQSSVLSKNRLSVVWNFFWIFTIFLFLCGNGIAKEKVIMLHAGSLSIPFAKIEKDFEAENPSIDIVRQSGGSRKMARMISEKHKPADIMASADYKVIDNLLIPKYANWNIRFAANQLVLCYLDTSKQAKEVNANNWYEILNKKDISWGHTDPNLDPCGYRSLMVLQLAEKYYEKPGLYEKLVAGRADKNVYASAADMVKVLKNHEIDYIWEYLSVAVQNDLKYVIMPDKINLGSYEHDDYYKQATLKVTGKKAGSEMLLTAKSITYGITITKDAPNPEGAILFMQYLLDPEKGLKVLSEMGQPPFIPTRVNSEDVVKSLPSPLQKLVEVKR